MEGKTQDQSPSPTAAPPKSPVFESIALLLLSMATIGTAWCSYEASSWGTVSAQLGGAAGGASRRAAQAELQARQAALLDILLFSHYINARLGSNDALARFYADRFRGEAKTAFDAWMATKPFENSNAPPHPFVTNFYQPRLLAEAKSAEDESGRLSEKAGEAGRISRGYVLITVLLASALFCGGTASKFDAGWFRRAVLLFGLAVFVFAATRLLLLPVQL